MILLGLLLTGVAVGAMVGAFDDDGTDEVSDTKEVSIPPEVTGASEGDDTLVGTDSPDLLDGDGGNDDLTGREGGDLLFGGEGNDLLKGRAGEDALFGGAGDDMLRGGQDEDVLWGGSGNDTLHGAEGDDVLIGAHIFTDDANSEDLLVVDGGLVLNGIFYSPPTQPEANELHGEEGNDTLLLGEGDIATGGSGSDSFDIGEWVEDSSNVPIITDFDEEEDRLVLRYAEGDPEPIVSLQTVNDERHVFADGDLVARLQGDVGSFLASDVILVEV